MELEASLPWLALTMTSGDSGSIVGAIAAPEGVFCASLTGLESCDLPAFYGAGNIQKTICQYHDPAGDGIWSRSVWGTGNVTQEESSRQIADHKQGAKLVTSAEDAIEELPTAIRAALWQVEEMESPIAKSSGCGAAKPKGQKDLRVA
jgi:hypothetical protein